MLMVMTFVFVVVFRNRGTGVMVVVMSIGMVVLHTSSVYCMCKIAKEVCGKNTGKYSQHHNTTYLNPYLFYSEHLDVIRKNNAFVSPFNLPIT